MTEIPEEEWNKIQRIVDTIQRREWEQEEDIRNLNNLLHALHGEGVRDRRYTSDGKPATFENGMWVSR